MQFNVTFSFEGFDLNAETLNRILAALNEIEPPSGATKVPPDAVESPKPRKRRTKAEIAEDNAATKVEEAEKPEVKTLLDAQKAVLALTEKNGRDAGLEVFAQFKINKLRALAEKDIPAFIEACEAAMVDDDDGMDTDL